MHSILTCLAVRAVPSFSAIAFVVITVRTADACGSILARGGLTVVNIFAQNKETNVQQVAWMLGRRRKRISKRLSHRLLPESGLSESEAVALNIDVLPYLADVVGYFVAY